MTRAAQPRISGRYFAAGLSRSSFPSSASRRTATAVICLPQEAMWKAVSGSIRVFRSRSARPNPAWKSTWPSRTTPTAAPGASRSKSENSSASRSSRVIPATAAKPILWTTSASRARQTASADQERTARTMRCFQGKSGSGGEYPMTRRISIARKNKNFTLKSLFAFPWRSEKAVERSDQRGHGGPGSD